MLDCSQCEHFKLDAAGSAQFTCNPFTNVKEPECLTKWQLLKLDASARKLDDVAARMQTMVEAYQATLAVYRRLAPMQEKMFRHMEREIDEMDESEKWKQGDTDEEEDDPFNQW